MIPSWEEETLSIKIIEHPTVLMKATKKARKWQKIGEVASIIFASLLVVVLVSAMAWTMFVTLKCNYCCSGPPIFPPYGQYGPK